MSHPINSANGAVLFRFTGFFLLCADGRKPFFVERTEAVCDSCVLWQRTDDPAGSAKRSPLHETP